ncbi:MAG: ComF family protein [Candidatus Tectomicrobia bacterium]|uniref:ComF family protein n=1 Tax=Tectimicrobiota bacterium TaxID=2528274 RepID=A0A932FXV5_UNCTE|nr:ComF family protein [Candidatus Tectomicrobia bacterium]
MLTAHPIASRILRFFFPENCGRCRFPLRGGERFVCQGCWEKIERIGGAVCPRCGSPFASTYALASSPGHLCEPCRVEVLPFAAARAVGWYRGALREVIHLFKYEGKMGLGPRLGALMADHLPGLFSLDRPWDEVLSVPLHRKRLKEREFDQSLILAQGLSRRYQIPLSWGNLVRTRWTNPQVGLNKEERRRNVQGAFALRKPDWVAGRQLLLIDDVYTTGATILECCRILQAAGAARVDVYTLARA